MIQKEEELNYLRIIEHAFSQLVLLISLTTKEELKNKFGIIQEFLVIFIFHEKELIRNYLGIPIPDLIPFLGK